MWIYGIVFILIAILIWLSRKEQVAAKQIKGSSVWYRCASYLQRKILLLQGFDQTTIVIVVVMLVGGCLLGAVVSGYEYKTGGVEIVSLDKGRDDVGGYQESLRVQEESGESQVIEIEIPHRVQQREQVEELFKQAKKDMDGIILGNNQTLERITERMNLITQLPDTAVAIGWTTNRPEILDSDGEIGADIPKEGVAVRLTAEFSYETYREKYTQKVKVFPPTLTPAEQRQQEILAALGKENQDAEEEKFLLPKTIENRKISWFHLRESNGFVIFGTVLMVMVVFLIGKRKEQMQQQELRKMQMMMDYPDILTKLILLLNAGLNMRKAFARIALDYKKQRDNKRNKRKIHYGYEELLLSFYEMERGVSEQEAYEHLGIRCALPAYRTLSVLLVQNLRKGNGELLEIMEREAATTFEERKRRAKILGEQASTKLLLPMGIMLMIVFAVLLIPAFLSF